jgi:hypothetical protein
MRISRRWVLQGGAGATLAIPVLTSLNESHAAPPPERKVFVGIMSSLGGIWANHSFPDMPNPDRTLPYAGRTIRCRGLTSQVTGSERSVCEVIRAPSTLFTPALVSKMNLVQGIDLPFFINHHSAATFGNAANGDAGNGDPAKPNVAVGKDTDLHPRSTIDQVMAHSSAFYANADSLLRRSIQIGGGNRDRVSYWFPTGGDGQDITKGELGRLTSATALWNELFGASTAAGARAPMIDLVREDYQRVMKHPRLSALDKQRLDQHLTRVREIERRLLAPTSSCKPPGAPAPAPAFTVGDPSSHANFMRSFQDLVVAALTCDLTRVVTFSLINNLTFANMGGTQFHDSVSHTTDDPGDQMTMANSRQRIFADVVVPLAARLNEVVQPNGGTLLDRTLLFWTQEHGTAGHVHENVPIVTFGSAGGAVKTGLHVDYRDLTRQIGLTFSPGQPIERPFVGLTFHQAHASLLQWMGVPRSDWGGPHGGAELNHEGYGYRPPNITSRQKQYRDDVEWRVAGEKLPFLTA